MRDGCCVCKSSFRYYRDIISMQGEYSEVFQPTERIFLNTLKFIVGNYQGCKAGEICKDKWWQNGNLVVTQIAE